MWLRQCIFEHNTKTFILVLFLLNKGTSSVCTRATSTSYVICVKSKPYGCRIYNWSRVERGYGWAAWRRGRRKRQKWNIHKINVVQCWQPKWYKQIMVWKWSYLVKQIVWKILFTHLVTAKCVHGSRAACLTMPLDRRASHSNRHPLIYVCSNQASHPFFVPACLPAICCTYEIQETCQIWGKNPSYRTNFTAWTAHWNYTRLVYVRYIISWACLSEKFSVFLRRYVFICRFVVHFCSRKILHAAQDAWLDHKVEERW